MDACPTCGATNITIEDIDEQYLYYCHVCGNMGFEPIDSSEYYYGDEEDMYRG